MVETPIQQSRDLKIVLSGLDNAGKTSMLVVINKMYQFIQDVNSLEPTIRIDYYQRDFLGINVNFWDMGGQKKYRERYLQRDIYFENIDTFIYLIDIQDPNRFEESLDYLEKILKIFKEIEYNTKNPIFICFTKMDFEEAFMEKPEYIANLAKVRKEILQKFSEFKFDFFSTSIYNVYSIVKMISMGLRRAFKNYDLLLDYIATYAENNDFNQILLFDDTGLIIAEYSNSLKDIGPNFYDETISEHLEFYKKTTDIKDKRFRYSRKTREDLMDICFRFKLDPSSEREGEISYYVSIIVDKEIGRKSNWDRMDLINILREKILEVKK